jgi:hypothetical protein
MFRQRISDQNACEYFEIVQHIDDPNEHGSCFIVTDPVKVHSFFLDYHYRLTYVFHDDPSVRFRRKMEPKQED